MKRWCVWLVCAVCPMLAYAESVEDFNIGTPAHPTMDAGFVVRPLASDETPSTDSAIPVSRLPEVPAFNLKKVAPSAEPTTSSDWSESHVARVLESAAKGGKLSYVLDAAKRHGLPASVALIPVIESRYQTNARSPKGAFGLWQLSRMVASDFHLPSQARFDVKASTEVALKHLSHLQTHYGRWDLTWAAYNAGQARVDTALKKHPDARTIEELHLPQETTHYVESLNALQDRIEQMDIAHA